MQKNLASLKTIVDNLIASEGTMEIYSLEEQLIGRWIDGKPLYRIVIKTDHHGTGDVPIPEGLNIDTVVDLGAIGHDSGNGQIWKWTIASNIKPRLYTRFPDNVFEFSAQASFYFDWIIVKYTKTTD